MAAITTNIEPGRYLTTQSLTVTFPAGTKKAIITSGDRAPVLTEIIAYDTGPIVSGGPDVERPFIAVTQDGLGNVVYDGGFPKFYNEQIYKANNNSWPALPYTSWSQLPPAARYMNNCIGFCANPRKLAQGNRKVLLMGDSVITENYAVKTSWRNDTPGAVQKPYGFWDSFMGIAQMGNWDLTIVDRNDTGGYLKYTATEFDKYAAVILISSYGYGSHPTEAQYWLPEATAKELSLYRLNGNGIIIVTDHTNANFTSLEQADAECYVFVPNANKAAKYYSAYFSGNVDRQDVSVGEIRKQLGTNGVPGDHALLKGLADTDLIHAGESESLTYPQNYDSDEVDHTKPWTTTFSTAGTYRVNVLVQLDDDTIITKPMRFVIIDPSDIMLVDSLNNNLGSTHTTYKQVLDLTVGAASNVTDSLSGEILINGTLRGYFTATYSGGKFTTVYAPFGGVDTPIAFAGGDQLKFNITAPFQFGISSTLDTPDTNPYYMSSGNVSTFIKKMLSHPYFANVSMDAMFADMTSTADRFYMFSSRLGTAIKGMWWRLIGKSRMALSNTDFKAIRLGIYTDATDWSNNKPVAGNIGDAVIIASTNEVYYWDNTPMVWNLHSLKANALFETGRRAISTRDSSVWTVGANTTTKV